MSRLTELFFLISDTLLWPVLLGLMIGLAATVLGIGQAAREALRRAGTRTLRRRVSEALENRRFDQLETLDLGRRTTPFFTALSRILRTENDPALVDKILADAKRVNQEKIAPMKLWLKFGPALGLMGTLIPLGPALVGLAAGDLQTMARNLQIAFATTVVGLLVSLIAYVLVSIHQRWAARDLLLLTFAANRREEKP
ncbi:MAG: MotA/TolQ/ExbB proton channel family protein [Thermoguttaceae bacterium]|nr:MotA/TolQ/ExbB proton channel family protein [Thermoguttaceae bacterium]